MKTFALTALAGIAFGANADVLTFDFNISDFGDTPGDVINFNFDFEAMAGGAIGSISSVSIELSHSWAEDILFSMTASNGSVFELLNGDGDGRDLGDGEETLNGLSTYTFVQAAGYGGFDDAPAGDFIVGGTYDAHQWGEGPWAPGSWNLSMRDRFGGDDGAVGSISIDYSLTPAPGAIALFGLGGLVATRRRR